MNNNLVNSTYPKVVHKKKKNIGLDIYIILVELYFL